MVENGKQGNFTKTGIVFEEKVNLINLFGHKKSGDELFINETFIGNIYFKAEILKYFKEKNIEINEIWSKKIYPECVIINNDKVVIIEIKFQKVKGSVDEKLQTFPFKIWQFKKLFNEVHYTYILSGFFKDEKYEDLFSYMKENDCNFFFESLPKDFLLTKLI